MWKVSWLFPLEHWPPGTHCENLSKRYQRGVKVVCKFKFSKLLPYQTYFRSKVFFWAEPRAFKVEWVANFRISKSWIFNFYLKILQQIIDSIPSFLHPTPRMGCQCSYAKEIRPKMTELEPFSCRRSKFFKNKPFAQNCDFRCFGGNFDFRSMGPILGGFAPFFFCSSMISYILG